MQAEAHTHPLLVCPVDGARLEWHANASGATCTRCGASLTRKGHVYTAGAESSEFYEGRYAAHVKYRPRSERLVHAWPLWLIGSGYLWTVRRELPAGSTVVELGCGGGIAYFGERYDMIGLDLSQASLEKAGTSYSVAMQCDVTSRLPLADDSVDGIISSSFLEHIVPGEKQRLVDECHRALRRGGKLVFLYDVETGNPAIGAMIRSDPEKYRRLFLENDGHVGYEPFERNLEYFRKAGFEIESRMGIEKTPFLAMSAITKLSQWRTTLGWSYRLGRILDVRPLNFAYMAYLRLLDIVFGPLLPDKWSRVALIVCRKAA